MATPGAQPVLATLARVGAAPGSSLMLQSVGIRGSAMKISRRDFLTTSTVAGLAAGVAWPEAAKPRLAFSTLGCPKWPWPQILDFAAANGYSGIELRGILGDLDLPNRPELASDKIPGVKKDLAAHGLKVSDLGSSSEMHLTDPVKRAQSIADAK